MAKKKDWITKVVEKNPGGLHRSLGIPLGTKIPLSKINAAAKKPGKVGRQARLAQTLSKMNRKGK
jgi:hypothetical protein